MIEQLRENDLSAVAAIVELDAQAFGSGGLNAWHLLPLIRHGLVFIYREQSQIAGSVQYMRDWSKPDSAYMYGITVGKTWRGRGIAGRLIAESLAILVQLGIKCVELTVAPENTAARRIYERLSFRQTDYRENEYGPGEHRLVMQLFLSGSGQPFKQA
jgi:ribosomal-protein-alanine N-acetyltransferase